MVVLISAVSLHTLHTVRYIYIYKLWLFKPSRKCFSLTVPDLVVQCRVVMCVQEAVVFSVEKVQAETHSFNTESFMGWV